MHLAHILAQKHILMVSFLKQVPKWKCLDMSSVLFISYEDGFHKCPHAHTHTHRSIFSYDTVRAGEKSGIHENECYRCQDLSTQKDTSGNGAARPEDLMLLQISGSRLVGRRSVLTLTDSRGKQCCMHIIKCNYSFNCTLLKCDVKVQSNMLFQCKLNTKLDERKLVAWYALIINNYDQNCNVKDKYSLDYIKYGSLAASVHVAVWANTSSFLKLGKLLK